MNQLTGEAVGLRARRPIVLEEHVDRAEEPVLVQRVEFEPVPVGQNPRTADQRDVVVVDDIEAPSQDALDEFGLEERNAGLLRRQRGQHADGTGESVHDQVGIPVVVWCRFPAGQKPIGIRAVDDLDLVTASGQLSGQATDEDAVAAEIVGRIEGSDHAES